MLIHISEDVCVEARLVASLDMRRTDQSIYLTTVGSSYLFTFETKEEQERAYVAIVQHINSGTSAIRREYSVLVRTGKGGTYKLRHSEE